MADCVESTSGTSASTSTAAYPDWKLELTMERLKQKLAQTRSFNDLTKNIRSAIVERRSILDQNDKVTLQKSLDILQQNIKVNSLQSMVERLEMISRQQGLRFHPGGSGSEWFISSDMFFLELIFDGQGNIEDVKIQHDGKTGQQNCPEIIKSLQKHDFTDFSAHLNGLVSIYSLNADKNIKSKVFIALQALEADLATIASTYNGLITTTETSSGSTGSGIDGDLLVMKTLLGVVRSRTGGHPLKLVFYISPYEFLDTSTIARAVLPNTAAAVLEHGLGTWATISVQGSSSHKLQMSAIVTVLKGQGGSGLDGNKGALGAGAGATPRYGTLNATNSTALPACFTFNLQKSMTVSKSIVERIHQVTGIESINISAEETKPILNLLTQQLSNGELDCKNDVGLFVSLPDQLHCYFMTENAQLDGIVINSISFTLANQLPQIITLLRQQMVFNTLIGSCVRVGTVPDLDYSVFEVNALSHQNITVSFEHPLEKSLVTLEFDLKDICHPLCRLHAVLSNSSLGAMDIIPSLEEHACRVVAKSMSIPVTLRAVIRRWQTLKPAVEPPNPTFDLTLGSAAAAAARNASASSSSCRTESASQGANSRSGGATGQQPQTPFIPAVVKANAKLQLPTTTLASVASSSLTISPIPATMSTMSSTGAVSSNSNSTQGQLDLINTYMSMNPLFKTLTAAAQFQSSNLHTNAALQMLASQLQQSHGQLQLQSHQGKQSGPSSSSTSSLLELLGSSSAGSSNSGVNNAASRKRKRKNSSEIPILPAPTPPSPSRSPKLHHQHQQLQAQGKSSHSPLPSPKRRMSESSNSDSEQQRRTPTPTAQSAVNAAAVREFMMSELGQLGLDSPNKWNLDITPVPSIDSFMATKLLSSFGAAASNIKQEPIDFDDFTQPTAGRKSNTKRQPRDHVPKRSMSLDSSAGGPGGNAMVPPSLSITPVVTSSGGSGPSSSSSAASTVSSLLAAMKSGIEIIPLHSNQPPISIPNSITVTPIVNNSSGSGSGSGGSGKDKKPTFQKKISAEEFDSILLGANTKKKPASQQQQAQKRKLSVADELLIKKTTKPNAGQGMGAGGSGIKAGSSGGSGGVLQQKKPHSPVLMRSTSTPVGPSNKGSTSSVGAGKGKPSVTTLAKTAVTATSTAMAKPKPKKAAAGGSTTTTQSLASHLQQGSKGTQKPLPALRPIFDTTTSASAAGSNIKSEPSTPTATTPGGSSGNIKNKSGFVQTGTVAKKGGLLAVIDKLKSQQSVEADNPPSSAGPSSTSNNNSSSGKKELSRLDCVKASSAITTEIQKVKATATATGNAGTTSSTGNSGTGGGNGSDEYQVKPGGNIGGGLKLTINKTGSTSPLPKDKQHKPAIKRSFSSSVGKGPSLSTVLAKIGNKKPKIEPGTGSSPSGTSGSVSGTAQQSASSGGTTGNGQKTGQSSSNNNSSQQQTSTTGRGSPKPKEHQQLDLTKKLFQPGAVRSLEAGVFDTPKFDSTFQIPKKSKPSPPVSVNTGSPNATATTTANVPSTQAASTATTTASISSSTVTLENTSAVQNEKDKDIYKRKTPSPPTETQSQPQLQTQKPSTASVSGSNNSIVSDTAAEESSKSNDEEPTGTVVAKIPELSTPESPDPSSSLPTLSLEETPRIPTTPIVQAGVGSTAAAVPIVPPTEPEIPVLENTADVPSSTAGTTAENPSTSTEDTITPPVLEVQQPQAQQTQAQAQAALAAEGKEDEEAKSSTATEMPPPPAPPLTPEPAKNSPAPAPISSICVHSPGPSPRSPLTSVTSIVHIVHSPQQQPPSSPAAIALLKSPLSLVVASPHSIPAASPYAIDDDLMDEALIGGNKQV